MSPRLTPAHQRNKMQRELDQKRDATQALETEMQRQYEKLQTLGEAYEKQSEVEQAGVNEQRLRYPLAPGTFPGDGEDLYGDGDAEEEEGEGDDGGEVHTVTGGEMEGEVLGREQGEGSLSLLEAVNRVRGHVVAGESDEAFEATLSLAQSMWVQSETARAFFVMNNKQLKSHLARYRELMDEAGVDYDVVDSGWFDEAHDIAGAETVSPVMADDSLYE